MKKKKMRSARKPGPSHPHLKRAHMSTMGHSAFAPPDPGMAFASGPPGPGAMALPQPGAPAAPGGLPPPVPGL